MDRVTLRHRSKVNGLNLTVVCTQIEREPKTTEKTSLQPGLEGLVTVIPQLLLLGFIFGSLVRFADSRPRSEVLSLVL